MTSDDSSTGSRTRLWWWIGGAVAAVVVVLVVVLATRGESGRTSPTPSSSSSSTPPSSTGTEEPTPDETGSGEPEPEPTSEAVAPTTGPGGRPANPPVDLEAEATPATGLTARVASIESVTGEANLPGEVGGPSLRVTVEVANDTAEAFDLSGTVVTLYMGADRAPAIELTKPGASPMPSSVPPGASVTGVYVFNVPEDRRDPITVEVDLAAQLPVVLFEGAGPPVG